MEFVTLKNSDLKVSRLCMGGCPMGGYGWGYVQEKELLNAIHVAIDEGINFFDTSDTYGLGQSEITLGKGLNGHRQDVVIASKFGVHVTSKGTIYDNTPEYIQKALEKSLQRLGTDYIDLYIIHYRDRKTPMSDVVSKLIELRDAGKIRYFGLSNIYKDGIEEIRQYKDLFVSCQNEYSLATRKNEKDLLLQADELDVTPTTWGSLGQGILTGKYTKENMNFREDDRRSRDIYVNFHGEKLDKNLRIVEVLKEIARERGKSVPSCAIRYILDFIPESVVLVGVKSSAQLLSNIEAMEWKLTKEELEQLDRISE